MDGDEARWAPPRPGRVDWPPVVTAPVGRALPDAREQRAARPLKPARRTRSAVRTLLLAYGALLAAIGLVVGGGSVLQPVYGSEAPYGGTRYGEVRTRPTPNGWSLSLASEFDPAVPPRCFTFRPGSVDAGHELVSAELPTAGSTGQDAECEVSSPETAGRLVMLDPATGRVLWRRSLASDLHETVFSLVWHASRSAGVVVVGVDGSKGDFLLTLAVGSGKTLSEGTVDGPDAVINFAVSDHLVVSVVPDVGGAVDTYSLRRTTDLGTELWSRSISSVLLPQLLPDRFVVPLPDGTVAVDGVTGRERPWGGDLRRLEGVRVTGDRVVAQTTPRRVGQASSVVMLDATGQRVWSRPEPSITQLAVSRGCVVVSTGAVRVTCLDPATGAVRWSSEVAGSVIGTPDGSTTSDVVSIGPVHAQDTALTVSEIDGRTGRVRFRTLLPRGSDVAAQATATGYSLGTDSSTGASTMSGFDLDSGRTLWNLRAADLDIWGGELVEITRTGIVHRLVDGRATAGHDMLVG
jgi:outer membrane protein assembly factor BamB